MSRSRVVPLRLPVAGRGPGTQRESLCEGPRPVAGRAPGGGEPGVRGACEWTVEWSAPTGIPQHPAQRPVSQEPGRPSCGAASALRLRGSACAGQGRAGGAVSRGASGVRRGSVRCGRRIAVLPSPQGCSAGPGILPALAESGQRGHVPLAGCGSEPRSGRPAAGGSEVARPRSAVEKVGARPRRKLGRDGPAELSATDPHGPAGTITWGEALR